MKNRILALAVSLLLPACAQTVLYSPVSGKRLACFQGDMVGSHYSGGGVTWDVQQVSHSATTLAQGAAAANVIGAAGTAIAGSLLAAGTSGIFPKVVGAAAPLASSLMNSKSPVTTTPAALLAH